MINNILWTSDDVEKATEGKCTSEFEATGVSIDTRSLKTGDIYVAIKGENLDGHKFVEEAFNAGASAAIVNQDFELDTDKPLAYVEDSFKALEDLGAASRKRTQAKIIAVTGSAGKTGTRELLAIAFSVFGKVHSTKKNFNNEFGVPLSLANMPVDTDYGVFELGMNHVGELEALTKQVQPDLAIITTIEPVHIENFKNIEEIAKAKSEIFLGMKEDGIAVLNIDNPHYSKLKTDAEKCGVKNILSFGEEEEEANSKLADCLLRPDSIKVTANIMGSRVKYKLNIPGKHIAINSLAVLTAVKALGCDLDKAVEALKISEPVEGRGNRISVNIVEGESPIIIIDESYNANPASMVAAFKVFEMVEPKSGGRRIAVLGDMLEIGREGPKMHAELMNPLLKAKTDLLFCCGSQMGALFDILPPVWQGVHAKDSQELAIEVVKNVKSGDVVLVKGSGGSKMSYVVHALQDIEKRKV